MYVLTGSSFSIEVPSLRPLPGVAPRPAVASPPVSRDLTPQTLKTMYYVPQTQNYVPSTLDTMYFHQKFDKKVELPNNV